LKEFRFVAGRSPPALFGKLPLDVSALALLIEGALYCEESCLPEAKNDVFVRCALRGQNLDRAGVLPQHMKFLSELAEPQSAGGMAAKLGCTALEASRVLFGLTLAELVESQAQARLRHVLAIESDFAGAQLLRGVLAEGASAYTGRVVRDRLALQLVLRRTAPEAIIVALDCDESCKLAVELKQSDKLGPIKWIGIAAAMAADDPAELSGQVGLPLDRVLTRPYSFEQVVSALDEIFEQSEPTLDDAELAVPTV
jgi:hypothetical protein